MHHHLLLEKCSNQDCIILQMSDNAFAMYVILLNLLNMKINSIVNKKDLVFVHVYVFFLSSYFIDVFYFQLIGKQKQKASILF